MLDLRGEKEKNLHSFFITYFSYFFYAVLPRSSSGTGGIMLSGRLNAGTSMHQIPACDRRVPPSI